MPDISKPLKEVKAAVASLFNDSDKSELQKFFIDELKDIYWAETHLVKAMPKMAKATTSEELRTAFENHLKQTEVQVTRLEQIFEAVGEKASAVKCAAMNGLIEEANTIIGDTKSGTMVRDCGLIFAAQKVEHYEIATYGSLRAVANILGLKKSVITLIEKTLAEEKDTDDKLTLIAETYVNPSAAEE